MNLIWHKLESLGFYPWVKILWSWLESVL